MADTAAARPLVYNFWQKGGFPKGWKREEIGMFCPQCGTENPEGARFCGNCRHPLMEGNDSSTPGPVIEVGGDRETVSDGLKYGILAGTLLIPFIGLVMGLIYLAQGRSEAKREVGRLWLYASIGVMVFYFIISSGV